MKNLAKEASPDTIMQIGTGFWASKIVLTAVNFELFTLLSQHGSMSASTIKSALKLNCTDRHVFDFLDVLTSLGFLARIGILEKATYSNSADADTFLVKHKPSYIGGMLEMMNNRLYDRRYLAGDEYTIADMAIYPWYGQLVIGELYNGQEFLDAASYTNVERWAKQIQSRPAVQRGERVNKKWGPEEERVPERHDASDFG